MLALIAHQLNVLHVLVVGEPELCEALDDVGKLVQLVVQALDLRQKEGFIRELNRHLVALVGVRYEGLWLWRFLGIVSLKFRLLTIGILMVLFLGISCDLDLGLLSGQLLLFSKIWPVVILRAFSFTLEIASLLVNY